jgi:hypothetical protein
MRYLLYLIVGFSTCIYGDAQTVSSDGELLAKARALYDAPFTRNLVSFDCAVHFDWKNHFVDFLTTVPPKVVPIVERLQTIQHRVVVTRSAANVSDIPKTIDLSGVAHAAELEQGLESIISAGLNAWLPASTNVILPAEPTRYSFQKINPGYKLDMNGAGFAATLLLTADMHVTSGISQLPEPNRFATEFVPGPDGLLLGLLKSGSDKNGEAAFAFTYQRVQGFQLPSLITVTSSTNETWRYALTDCKAMTGVTIKVGLPVSNPAPAPSPSLDGILIPQ